MAGCSTSGAKHSLTCKWVALRPLTVHDLCFIAPQGTGTTKGPVFPGSVDVVLVATAVAYFDALGNFAVEAVSDVETDAVVDAVALLPFVMRTRGCHKVWEEFCRELFTARADLGAGGESLFSPLAWTSTTGSQQHASRSEIWCYHERTEELAQGKGQKSVKLAMLASW